jgi:serine/threonine protein kinase
MGSTPPANRLTPDVSTMPSTYSSRVRSTGQGVEVYQCNCGKEFKVTGYPDGYKFACPQCHAFCIITRNEEELPPGTRLGDFVVQHLIGRGGNGIVYLGRQISLDRAVAIKALRPGAAAYGRFVKRFSQEARTAAQIVHSNVVQIYFVGRKESTFFIAMEYVNGRSVRQLINETGGLEERRAIDLILQACKGLKRAHRMNVLHRDIKPDNLLVSREGEVKVADFGLALDLDDYRKQDPPRRVEGSPHYMSPEQAMRGEASFASDIYSLGPPCTTW